MEPKKRVLFVDDEPSILAAMRLMMRRERDRWEMVFVEGGESALTEIDRQPFDVVVSDMRMPGMDGAELLATVRARNPATVRVMLTGYADSESIMRALPSIHQLFAKPCQPGGLRSMLERCRQLDALSGDATVLATVGALDQLPSPPLVYQRLQELISRGGASVVDASEVIAGDPACAARVLQLANSSFFGDGTIIHSIDRAVACLGLERVQLLVLGASMTASHSGESRGDTSDCVRVVSSMVLDPAQRDIAVAAALLRDVGCDVLRMRMGNAYLRICELASESGRPLVDLERERLGLTHADVGAGLLAIWGLPEAIVQAVRFHHAHGDVPELVRDVVNAIRVAESMATRR